MTLPTAKMFRCFRRTRQWPYVNVLRRCPKQTGRKQQETGKSAHYLIPPFLGTCTLDSLLKQRLARENISIFPTRNRPTTRNSLSACWYAPSNRKPDLQHVYATVSAVADTKLLFVNDTLCPICSKKIIGTQSQEDRTAPVFETCMCIAPGLSVISNNNINYNNINNKVNFARQANHWLRQKFIRQLCKLRLVVLSAA